MSDDQNSYQTDKPEKGDSPEIRYIPVEYTSHQQFEDEQINLLDIAKTAWDGRKTILIIAGAFTLLGIFHYLFGPTEYESDSILLQETQTQGGQAQQFLQRLGGGFGISSSGISDERIPPSLYPQIVYSAEFQRELLFEEVEFEDFGFTISLFDYFTNHYEPPTNTKVYGLLNDVTIGLPFTLIGWIKGGYNWMKNGFTSVETVEESEGSSLEDSRYLMLSREERRAISNLRDRINIEMDGGLITVKTRLPDPMATAAVNYIVVGKIQEYVTNYRIEKAQQNLRFVELQQEEAKERYDEAQQELARFSDQNVSLSTALARTQLEELQNRRNLQFSVYNSISQQVEQARLNVQEQTPVFNVLQRSSIPTSSTGNSELVIVVAVLLGSVLGILWIFVCNAFYVIKQYIQN